MRSYRSAVLLSLGVFFVLAALAVLVAYWSHDRAIGDARAEMTLDLSTYAQALATSVSTRLAVQTGLNEYAAVESPTGIDPVEFQSFATGLRTSVAGITSVHIAPGGVVAFVSPRSAEPSLMGRDLVNDPRPDVADDIARAISSREIVISGPYTMLTGPYGIVTRQAVFDEQGEFWGITSVQIEMQPLLEESGVVGSSPGFDLAVRSSEGSMVAGSAQVFDRDPVTYKIDVANQDWMLAGVPTQGWESVAGSNSWQMLLAAGLTAALAGAFIVYRMSSQQVWLRAEVDARTSRMAEMNTRLVADLQAIRRVEETLRESEERFRLLWAGSPHPILGATSGVITIANDALVELFGYERPEDVTGRTVADLVDATQRTAIAQRMRSQRGVPGHSRSFETQGVRSDGESFPMKIDMVELDLPGGAMSVLFITDLTERVASEQMLRESAAQYRVLFENSPVSLWEEDFSAARRFLGELDVPIEQLAEYLADNPDALAQAAAGMAVQRVNRTTIELWGARSEADLTGGLDPYVLEVNKELYILELVAIAKGQQRFFGAAEIPSLDGRMMFANVYWTVAPGYEDTYEKVFVSIIDLSDQRRMQQQLERYKDTLESLVEERTAELSQANRSLLEATRAKDKFLAAMSHELRTPLNSIIGFSGTVLQRLAGDINEEQERQLTLVQRSGQHLLRLINQVLDLSRIEAGQEVFEPTRFETRALVDELIDDVATLAESDEVRIVGDALGAPEFITSDRDRLKQILLNLLANAIKFTPAGEVRLSASSQGDLVVFRVRDTGPGIPFEEQANVFEAFHQIRTAAGHKPAGTGLGLSISRELATLLGGEISLESEPGTGSCFIVRIPIERPGYAGGEPGDGDSGEDPLGDEPADGTTPETAGDSPAPDVA